MSERLPRRVAVLSVHTSPTEQPGTGDAGGMNVYVAQTAIRMARRGVEAEIFTRATSSEQPSTVELEPGATVRFVAAGPFEGLGKDDLPSQLCAFTAGVLRAEARHDPGWYDVVHSHYWLSGQVGWLARDRWGVPLVHSAHTLAKVKNAALAAGDTPEPRVRVIGEDQVVAEADRLVANTEIESKQLLDLYDADPHRTVTIPPGVDTDRFRPGDRAAARAELGLPAGAVVLAFVGRIQRLKAPDVLLRAAAELVARVPGLRERLVVLVAGGPSGSGLAEPTSLHELAAELGITDLVRFLPPRAGDELVTVYRAADVVAVPSHNESFGLVALEAQACGTPVVATRVGGLPVAVAEGRSGLLVTGHDISDWADALGELALDPGRREQMGRTAATHAHRFSWDRTTDALLGAYDEARTEFAARRRGDA
ncbi:Glycosyltransferase MshA involved in mycothiol biosynthesis [Pseudonocardia sp. Ae406_Ps2]|uniref:D-inositol-3-phosphate glycosyltransferase n=1 Tax=unclassified Pseudonocardia TaxID=2619320 RepID=UPI00094A9DEE|nr:MULTISPECIES: D-inositol-3-phosphate glycosyltransferase [unclassified Pseudonocardia]OLL97853.1 Glycosyltransferase MshA involved in mycothiol biosynthesis [Pseudonocardia sp. Ae331_Ps2]OLM04438.1 Glycosyltransferase MshA involved in mycothiol biosynthesis [Pseudonocardia sp. Ae406_Ps2]OLM10726.1 Glycosyltransferase MshA involved in mycothiol biosynthesis [Pseudonocardia sp. Ae505_Ps2]OLM26001.1 Glycosyltransferase MshA involved in mycothiol biosynthesis [Pseudonocardia sp. Ae706_Ps2]OLM33